MPNPYLICFFFLLLLSLSKRFAQKCIFFICQNLSSVSDYPLKLSNVSHKICFHKVQTWCICTGPHPKSSKCCGVDDKILTKKVRVKTSHLIFGYVHFHFIGWDFATFNIKNFLGGTSKKIHSVCFFKKHSITNRNIICF